MSFNNQDPLPDLSLRWQPAADWCREILQRCIGQIHHMAFANEVPDLPEETITRIKGKTSGKKRKVILPRIERDPNGTKASKRLAAFTRLFTVIALIYDFVLTSPPDKVVSLRTVYYLASRLLRRQSVSDSIIDDLCTTAKLTRHAFGIAPRQKSWFAATGGLRIKFQQAGSPKAFGSTPTLIPADDEIAELILPKGDKRYRFVMVIEKHTAFTDVVQSVLNNSSGIPGIVLTGCGYPDIEIRKFLKRLRDHPEMKKCDFWFVVDNDVDGLAIAATYIVGSQSLRHHPDISGTELGSRGKLIGLLTGEVPRVGDPVALTSFAIKKGRRMLAKKTLTPELEDELEKLLAQGASRDLQAGTRPFGVRSRPATVPRRLNGTEAYLNAKIAALKNA